MEEEEYARNEIYSELDAIVNLYNLSYEDAYEAFLDDYYDCYHVIEYKYRLAREWLNENTEI